MGWFRKKPKKEQREQLVFKSNAAAFQYACQFLNTSLDIESPVLGIVIEKQYGVNKFCVKLSNPDDSSVPTVSVNELLENGQSKHLCPYEKPLDRVPPLQEGV